MIELLGAGIGIVIVLPLGFLGGWIFAHRRLPETLARMSDEELAALAHQTVAHKHLEEPRLPTLDERNAAALDAAYAKHAQLGFDG